jgi:adenosylcobinamide-GDP ribazoletransferase
MGFFQDLRGNIAFLTRLPVGNVNLNYEDLSKKMWMFPFIGLILGVIVGFCCQVLFRFLPSLIVGFLALCLLIFLTGAHHTDGLLDFGDGVMTSGTPERKIEAMHDVATGTGGIVLGLCVLSLTGLTISYLPSLVLVALVTAEVGAKFAMVVACATGKSAGTRLANPFIKNTTKMHLLIALLLSLGLIYVTLVIGMVWKETFSLWEGMNVLFIEYGSISPLNNNHVLIIFAVFLLGSIIPTVFMKRIANRNFKGLTGDCLGALNEITRVFILILILLVQTGFQVI